ncbi:MAG: translation initiation factor IF-2 [Candidatus Wildermuthbacteria bacterium RIFCSPLOWO2_01_FULL_47_18]|uniref:Translation initiation factor IF-2 n=1 Tax=Candidatus Wildermuthbacteria bacterium RIFCSPLOWO2_01_FULL_47_18 TaxID=1802460 RepID=A0A1G2RGD3_9BACT|nr:MAG: translation initiation factor IF-2 [Candidatus Wildermuthbacteria bacterium RIFCSPLOWO2_01_FULL_47_18]
MATTTKTTTGVPRPPIVVVLGHVDHGKSSLLEAIREEFKITSKESGGITQHIGAYVAQSQGKNITFIDTPGHEAFSALRSRGANVADIAILVVAADDGIQPQTKEAIEVIRKTQLPFVVAVNKIDVPGADVERTKRDLSSAEVFVEGMGGNVPVVGTSATTKKGIVELLEVILLLADLENLRADPESPGKGVVIESSMDSQRGGVASLLVRDGKVSVGDILGTKSVFGKVKILEDFQGNPVETALPSFPALAIGFEEAPRVGEEFQVFRSEEDAKEHITKTGGAIKTPQVVSPGPEAKVLNVILKADVAGSLEALEGVLLALPQENMFLRVVHSDIGEINEGDIKLAQGSKAKILGFRTGIDKGAEEFAKREHVTVMTFDIIYDLIQAVRKLMEKPETHELVRKQIGELSVLAVFFTEKSRQIIGGKVKDGEIRRGATIEIVRNEAVVGRGKMLNLQKDKQDASQVLKNQECGISYEGDVTLEVGDTLRFFIEERE